MKKITLIKKTIENINKTRFRNIETYSYDLSPDEADAIVRDCQDLIDDEKYLPFFYKKLYTIGKGQFVDRAERARKYGHQPSRLFVQLLKK